MPYLDYIFLDQPELILPSGWLGWISCFMLLTGLVYLLRRWSRYHTEWTRQRWGLFILLIIFIPITSLFIPGIRFPSPEASPIPWIPLEPIHPAVMVFAALPWTLAAGFLGVIPAASLAFTSGLILAFWDTHNLSAPLVMALMATVISWAVQQYYRTPIYRGLRHPFLAAIVVGLVYIPLSFVGSICISKGLLVDRINYASSQLIPDLVSVGTSLVVAGVFTEIAARAWPSLWNGYTALVPSPAEVRLETRFLYSLIPLVLVVAAALMVGDWVIAGSITRQMLEGRMESVAELASQSVPYFIQTGQSLLAGISGDQRLLDQPLDEMPEILKDLRIVPYFTEVFLFDHNGNLLAGRPEDKADKLVLTAEERKALQLALTGLVPSNNSTVPPDPDGITAKISFLESIGSVSGVNPRGVLVGRSDLSMTPLAKPILTSLDSMANVDGQGILIDENKRIIYHPDSDQLMTTYTGKTADSPSFFEDTAKDGTRQLVYYMPVVGGKWAVIVIAPAYYSQQQALRIATPMLIMIFLLSMVAIVMMRFGVGRVTRSLQQLAAEADRMARGQLDEPLRASSEDEVGQLALAFEQMRSGLKDRMDELNRLLQVSQGVASSLDMSESLRPILESAVIMGASSARVVLAPSVVTDLEGDNSGPSNFSLGLSSGLYQYLDDQIMALTRQKERLVLSNLTRPRMLDVSRDKPRPQSIMSVALLHENLFYGVLWIAYDQPHQFEDGEIRYLVTISGQAALAVANAHLFLSAETGRRRLETILASTPDPVLVTNSSDRLLLANPAAWHVFGFDLDASIDLPIDKVIAQNPLVKLLKSSVDEEKSAEIVMPRGQVYLATASSIIAEGHRMGRVCVLRDVTQFKKLDALKSEFVSTVSHDLRSPLTLVQGYATMLQMVGELNDQQANYLQKIVASVENMSRLVSNLLDLGRIEAGVGLKLEKIAALEVVERVVGGLKMRALQKKVDLNIEVSEVPLVEADPALLEQALQNLVDNAIKYSEAEEQVNIRLRSQDEQLIIEVSDSGIGIPPADQQRLFEKFYRVSRFGRRGESGSGLGLAIVKSIAEQHGGRVWFESQLGKGSTFYLAIPVRQIESGHPLD